MNRLLVSAAAALVAFAAPAWADKDVNPRDARPGAWVHMGTTTAKKDNDHDTLSVHGDDDFRKIKFKVTDAPLDMNRMVVTYENGQSERIEVRQRIQQGGDSRPINLKGQGTRSIRKIDFWYSTSGSMRGTAEVRVFGQR